MNLIILSLKKILWDLNLKTDSKNNEMTFIPSKTSIKLQNYPKFEIKFTK